MHRVAIHSVPRSGSTWLGCIFDSCPNTAYRYQPLFSFGHKGQVDENSSLSEIDTFFNEILHTNDDFVLQKAKINTQKGLKFKKKHITHVIYKEVRYHHILANLLKKDKSLLVIGLIRNPFAVLNSWLNAPREFKKELGWAVEKEWRYASKKNQNKPEEFHGYEKWKEIALLFLQLKKQYSERFYLLQYEDLLVNRINTVQTLFDYCNLNVKEQTLTFLKESTNREERDAYSVFKKKKNDDAWKEELPNYIIDEIKNDTDFKKLNKMFKWI